MSKILLKEADYIVPILFLSVFYYDLFILFGYFPLAIFTPSLNPPHTHTILSEYTEYNFMNPSALQDKNP